MVRSAWVIAHKDLRQRLRDRSALAQGVLAPIVLSVIVGVAFGGGGPSLDVDLGVVDEDGSPISVQVFEGLVGSLEADDFVSLVAYDDEPAATAGLDDGDLDALLVLPAGFGAEVAAGVTPQLRVVVDPSRVIARTVAAAFAEGVTARVRAVALGLATAELAAEEHGVALSGGDPSAIRAASGVAEQTLVDDYRPITFFAPSMAILFLFFTLGSSAQSMLVERREWTLARMLAAPVRPDAILLGKTGSVLVLGLVSLLTVYAVTEVAFGAGWGNPAGVVAVIVGAVVAIAGVSVLVTGLARTDSQANNITLIVAFSFAILGGNFIGPGGLPPFLATARFATPNGWAMASFTELAAGGADVGEVAVAALVLVAMGVVAGGAGLLVLRRRLVG
jgi:ABC-2 type transport system permease protein